MNREEAYNKRQLKLRALARGVRCVLDVRARQELRSALKHDPKIKIR